MVFSGEYSNGALQIVCDDDDEKEKNNSGGDNNDHDLLLSYHGNDNYNSVHTIDGMKKMKQSSTKENDSALPSSSSKVKQKGKAVITTGSGDGNSKKDTVATSQSTTTTAEGKSRNRPPTRGSNCPCGSGKKYKKCCLAAEKSKKRLAKHVEKKNGSNDSADNENEKREDSFIGDFKVLTILFAKGMHICCWAQNTNRMNAFIPKIHILSNLLSNLTPLHLLLLILQIPIALCHKQFHFL